MSYSTYNRSINAELYSEYLIENKHSLQNEYQTPIKNKVVKNNLRKISQASTLSFKSRNKKYQSNEKRINSSNRNYSKTQIKNDLKNSKRKQFQCLNGQIKKYSMEKNRNYKNKNYNYSISNKKQALKLDKNTNHSNKTQINLTSRPTKCYTNYLTEKQTKHTRKSSDVSGMKTLRNQSYMNKKQSKGTKINSLLKIKDKNLQLILSRCEKVMTEYFEHINQLQKQNQLLKEENIKLKKSGVVFNENEDYIAE